MLRSPSGTAQHEHSRKGEIHRAARMGLKVNHALSVAERRRRVGGCIRNLSKRRRDKFASSYDPVPFSISLAETYFSNPVTQHSGSRRKRWRRGCGGATNLMRVRPIQLRSLRVEFMSLRVIRYEGSSRAQWGVWWVWAKSRDRNTQRPSMEYG